MLSHPCQLGQQCLQIRGLTRRRKVPCSLMAASETRICWHRFAGPSGPEGCGAGGAQAAGQGPPKTETPTPQAPLVDHQSPRFGRLRLVAPLGAVPHGGEVRCAPTPLLVPPYQACSLIAYGFSETSISCRLGDMKEESGSTY